MGVYTQTNGASMPVSTGGKGTSMSMPTAWNHPAASQSGFGDDYGGRQVAQPPQADPNAQAAFSRFRNDITNPRDVAAQMGITPPPPDPTAQAGAQQQQQQWQQQQGAMPPSTGGKGTNQAVGAGPTQTGAPVGPEARPISQMVMRPENMRQQPPQNYAYQQQPAWLNALAAIFQRPQQPAFRYQAQTYDQMRQQALPLGWQTSPVYTPPPPPVTAPPPAAPVQQPATQPQIYDPVSLGFSGHTMARGGRAGYRQGGAVPTEAQKHAGNYKKDHITFHGLPISIETPKGQAREGKDATGKSWRCVMPADYGYIKKTEGADGDHVDVYVGPDRNSQMVFLINQNDHQTGKFDEHKVMLGYSSERAAVADYVKAFSDGKGADRVRSVEPMSLDGFKQWLKLGKTKTPAKASSIVEHALAVVRSKK